MKIGITGHQRLDNPDSWNWVEQELIVQINKLLSESKTNLTGISSLAVGADQLFARLIIELSGKLHAVLPFSGYENKFSGDDLDTYRKLVELAHTVETLPAKSSDEESYFAAGKRVVELSDVIVAVWNGKKAAGLGGTGDAVKYAEENSKKVIHINPVSQKVFIIK